MFKLGFDLDDGDEVLKYYVNYIVQIEVIIFYFLKEINCEKICLFFILDYFYNRFLE